MLTTLSWPAADSLLPAALDLTHRAKRFEEAASYIYPIFRRTGSTLLQSVEEKLSIICFRLAHECGNPDKAADMNEYDQKIKGLTV